MDRKTLLKNRELVDNSYLRDIQAGKYKSPPIRNIERFKTNHEKTGVGRRIKKPVSMYGFKDYYTLYSGKPRFAHMTDEMKAQEVEKTIKTVGKSAYGGLALGLAAAVLTGIKAAAS